jgi:hypothetical protein
MVDLARHGGPERFPGVGDWLSGKHAEDLELRSAIPAGSQVLLDIGLRRLIELPLKMGGQ